MSVRYIIVDDEAPSRRNLRLALDAHPGWVLAAECDSAAAARRALATGGIDVVFLDVQMPVESGLVLARELSQQDLPPLIIFVTAYSEHAVDAFEMHALDYLLKPINDARLAQAVERTAAMLALRQRDGFTTALRDFASDRTSERITHISVRSVGHIEQVLVDDILWIESAGNYAELHLASRTVLHRITLSRLEALLPPEVFLRVHRSFIVRRDQVESLATTGDGTYQLTLRCGAVVPVSERNLDALKLAL